MGKFDNISVIAFDADDTLWDCQSHFADAERRYCGILEHYADATTVSDELFAVESANMPLLGYGGKAFTISLVENALKLSGYRISAADVARIIDLGKSLLSLPATPLPGVRDALEALRGYRLVLFTKGELHYVADGNNWIQVAFLTKGDPDQTDSFIVYDTSLNYQESTGYYLDVIVNGVDQKNYQLTAKEYAAIDKYGVAEQISYISTGGGAFLEFVEGKVLPAVEVLEQRAS